MLTKGKAGVAGKIAGTDSIVKTVLFYFYERAWVRAQRSSPLCLSPYCLPLPPPLRASPTDSPVRSVCLQTLVPWGKYTPEV